MTVSITTLVEGASNDETLSVSITANATNSNRVLIAVGAAEGAGTMWDSVQISGVSSSTFTVLTAETNTNGTGDTQAIAYLLNAKMPSAGGSYTVAVDYAAGVGGSAPSTTILEMLDASQTIPSGAEISQAQGTSGTALAAGTVTWTKQPNCIFVCASGSAIAASTFTWNLDTENYDHARSTRTSGAANSIETTTASTDPTGTASATRDRWTAIAFAWEDVAATAGGNTSPLSMYHSF